MTTAETMQTAYVAYVALVEEHNAKQADIRADESLNATERFLAAVRLRLDYDEPIARALLATLEPLYS
jgi:hypothetical protein